MRCHRSPGTYETGIPRRSSAGEINLEVVSVKTVFNAVSMDKVTGGGTAGKEEGQSKDCVLGHAVIKSSGRGGATRRKLPRSGQRTRRKFRRVWHPGNQLKNILPGRKQSRVSTEYC